MIMLCGYLICWGDVAELEDGSREQFECSAFLNGSARLVLRHNPRPGAIPQDSPAWSRTSVALFPRPAWRIGHSARVGRDTQRCLSALSA